MKGLLINAIAAAVEAVSAAIEERAAVVKARAEMHDFCEKGGYYVTPVMHKDPVSFMETVNRYVSEGRAVRVEYKEFPVTITRTGNRARSMWNCSFDHSTSAYIMTVHSGEVNF